MLYCILIELIYFNLIRIIIIVIYIFTLFESHRSPAGQDVCRPLVKLALLIIVKSETQVLFR